MGEVVAIIIITIVILLKLVRQIQRIKKEGVILQTNIPTSKDSKEERKKIDLLTNKNIKQKQVIL